MLRVVARSRTAFPPRHAEPMLHPNDRFCLAGCRRILRNGKYPFCDACVSEAAGDAKKVSKLRIDRAIASGDGMRAAPEVAAENAQRDERHAWILTASGRTFWPLAPRRADVVIEDIAKALSQLCRFTGHCRSFYSVAEHSWRVSYACEPQDALWGLLHDGAEAYVCDVARPLKYTSAFDGYRAIEARVQRVIFETFGLYGDPPASVKHADLRLLVTERRDLMPQSPPWGIQAEPLRRVIRPMSPGKAEREFLHRFKELARLQGAA